MSSKPFETVVENVFKTLPLQPDTDDKKEMIDRVLSLLSRLVKCPAGAERIIMSKDIVFKLHVYYAI